ncbi:MAG: glycosyltransferase, partial [Candidatus Aenigmarchaeota archaeon]|nr:glycosyltransferase [Candidatus Aenigmarchaeota archaeon]MDW8149055.1 glycosyltransferase [Candidatus Aenigmarchaeota archaeon]
TYKNYEIIVVVDKKSKDKTFEIAKKYTKNVYYCEKSGISAARNFGAKKATGEIFLFLDADTIVLPNLLETFYKQLRSKKIIGCFCPKLPSKYDVKFILAFILYNNYEEISSKVNKAHIAGNVCAYKKKYFEMANGFDESVKVLEDFDLSSRISKFGKITYVKDTFVVTSSRRLEKLGFFKSILSYIKYYIKFLTFKELLKREKLKQVR